MICDDRKAAPGFRAEAWAEGRKRREDGADARPQPTQQGVCALGERPPPLAQSPTAQPHQEALRNLGSAVMGSRKTGSESGLELGKREHRGLFPTKAESYPLNHEDTLPFGSIGGRRLRLNPRSA